MIIKQIIAIITSIFAAIGGLFSPFTPAPGPQPSPTSHPPTSEVVVTATAQPEPTTETVAVTVEKHTVTETAPALSAETNPHPTIQQGNAVIIEGRSMCTLGFIDHAARTGIIAGHCSTFDIDEVVTTKDGREIGTVKSKLPNEKDARRDIGIITFNDDVELLENTHTGDTVLNVEDVEVGQTLCSYSSVKETVRCGEVIYLDDNIIIGDRNAGGWVGDSGGPAWIVATDGTPLGFAGVFSLLWEDLAVGFTNINQVEHSRSNDEVRFIHPDNPDVFIVS